MKKQIAVVAAAALTLVAAPAAAVTINSSGTGFIGKGEVQSAMGWNDKKLQDNAPNVRAFTVSRGITQALSSSASQSTYQAGTQSATQSATQTAVQGMAEVFVNTVSCTFINEKGNSQLVVHHREGYRPGTRAGSAEGSRTGYRSATRDADRTGTRTGSRSGTQTGTQAAAVEFEPRKNSNGKNGPITGFWAKGWMSGPDDSFGAPTWSDPTFGDWEYGDWVPNSGFAMPDYTWGEYTWGAPSFSADISWGDWESDPQENPASCLGGNTHNTEFLEYSNETESGGIVYGDILPTGLDEGTVDEGAYTPTGDPVMGDVTFGDTEYGAVTPTGTGAWTITGVTLN